MIETLTLEPGEPKDPKPPKSPRNAEDVTGSIVFDLLLAHRYVNLSLDDLREAGVLGHDLTLKDLVKEQLQLETSFQYQAYAELFKQLPKQKSKQGQAFREGYLLSPKVETAVRLEILEDKLDTLMTLRPADHLAGLTEEIMRQSGPLEVAGSQSFDVTCQNMSIRRRESLYRQEPGFLTVEDQNYFAIQVPSEDDDLENLGVIHPSLTAEEDLSRFVVVADREKSAKLTDQFLDDPALVKYYIAKVIAQMQLQKLRELNEKVKNVAAKKSEKFLPKVNEWNWAVQRHFFELLIQSISNVPQFLIEIYRSMTIQDTSAAMSATYMMFSIAQVEPGVLRLQLEDNASLLSTQSTQSDGEEFSEKIEEKVRVDVRMNAMGTGLEYQFMQYSGAMSEWVGAKQEADESYFVRNLFEQTLVISLEQMSQNKEPIFAERDLKYFSDKLVQLLAINDPIKFLQRLCESQPEQSFSRELILSPMPDYLQSLEMSTPSNGSTRLSSN